MEIKKLIMKCCICGRVKTDEGWQYQFREQEEENMCSHGFCAACYESEIQKIKMQAVMPALVSYQW